MTECVCVWLAQTVDVTVLKSVLDLLQQLLLLVQPIDSVIPSTLHVICARLQTTVSTSCSSCCSLSSPPVTVEKQMMWRLTFLLFPTGRSWQPFPWISDGHLTRRLNCPRLTSSNSRHWFSSVAVGSSCLLGYILVKSLSTQMFCLCTFFLPSFLPWRWVAYRVTGDCRGARIIDWCDVIHRPDSAVQRHTDSH